MKAVVQRVERASVRVVGEAEPTGTIGPGILVLLGVAKGDDEATARKMADKIRGLRIFPDDAGRMSRNVGDAVFPDATAVGEAGVGDEATQAGRSQSRILVVSQFTLLADTRKGTRPSFTAAADPELANRLYELVADELTAERGRFGGDMRIELVADGPVTIALEIPPPAPA
jgi:D-tyrosyl-tRNA(Tyr) deacylase